MKDYFFFEFYRSFSVFQRAFLMRFHLVRHSCVDGKDNLSINPEVEEIGGAPAFLLISHFFTVRDRPTDWSGLRVALLGRQPIYSMF
jgi:hypothetical protein